MVLTWTSLFTNQTIDRSTFVTNVRARFDEDTADVATDAQIYQWINTGLRNISFLTGLLPQFAETACDGSAYYDLPSGLSKLNEVVFVDSGGTNAFLLLPTNRAEATADGYTTSYQKFYVREGNRIYLFGTPTSGTLRIYGTKIPTVPTADGEYIDLPDEYIELLYFFVEWKFWTRRREPDEAALAREMYFRMAEQVRQDVSAELSHKTSMHGKKSTRV